MFSIDTSGLRGIIGDLREIIEDEIKETVLTVHRNVTKNTAVDTGLARSNWQVTKQNPATSVLPIGSAQANVMAAMGIGYSIGDTFYITNPVDYVYYLNYGSSRRAGDFFVESSIRSSLSQLNRN